MLNSHVSVTWTETVFMHMLLARFGTNIINNYILS